MDSSPRDVTELLIELRVGNRDAEGKLIPLVYDELRRLAAHYMRQERPGHTLQPTGLVNEAYLRLGEKRVRHPFRLRPYSTFIPAKFDEPTSSV